MEKTTKTRIYFVEKDSGEPDGYCAACAGAFVANGLRMERTTGTETECSHCDKELPKVKR